MKFSTLLFAISFLIFQDPLIAQSDKPADLWTGAAENTSEHLFVKWIKVLDIPAVLKSGTPYTLFLPTSTAMDGLSKSQRAIFEKKKTKAQAAQILKSHIVEGNWDAQTILQQLAEQPKGIAMKSISGSKFQILQRTGSLYIKDEQGKLFKIQTSGIETAQGWIYTVDRMMGMP